MVRALLSSGNLLALQLVAVAAGLGAIVFYPPSSGRMMLVPLWPGAADGMAAQAIDAGALLVDGGPLPHSLVVSGTRADIAAALLSPGILIVSAPGGGCVNEAA